MKTLTLTGDDNTPAMPMTEAQVNHRRVKPGRNGLGLNDKLEAHALLLRRHHAD